MRCLFINWQNIHDLFAVAVHNEYSLMWPHSLLIIEEDVYHLQYKHPHPATQVTFKLVLAAAIVD